MFQLFLWIRIKMSSSRTVMQLMAKSLKNLNVLNVLIKTELHSD
jgi:hypothetical protein